MRLLRVAWRLAAELAVHLRAGQAPASRFLIFAQGRTGTWLMTHFLNDHPAIQCDKEILMSRKLAPLRYMAARSRLCGGKVYGCHVQINQLLAAQRVEPRAFLRQVAEEGWRILYLKREDIVRQSISTIIATRRRQWYVYDLETLDRQPISIPPAELMAWLERRVVHYRLEAECLQALPHLTISYESDLRDAATHQATMDRVFGYLGLPTLPVRAQTRRLSDDCLRDSVANFDDLLGVIRRSGYARYTDLC
jgi:hypothetical protein